VPMTVISVSARWFRIIRY